jgi:cyanophycinase
VSGSLALGGGGSWEPGNRLDAALVDAASSREVVVLPTAAAYEHPQTVVERARACFEPLGVEVRGLDVLHRSDALDAELAAVVEQASFVYLADGSPLHLRSVLKDSPVLDALRHAWAGGATVVGAGAGAVALCDPMVDPRGGALTVGLGLVVGVTVLAGTDGPAALADHRRTLELADPGVCVVAVPERTAVVRGADGTWRSEGEGEVSVFLGGEEADLSRLP